MLPRPLFAMLQFALSGAGDKASNGQAEMGRRLVRLGLRQAKREVGWEPVLLLGGAAVVWWSLSALIDPGAAFNSPQGLPSLAADQGWPYRGFFIAIPGLLGLIAMYAGLTLGVLELMVSLELSKATDPAAGRRG